MKHSPWHHHPGVKTGAELPLGDRAADVLRNSMGSWPFVFSFIATMVAWAALNSLMLGDRAFDKYPYILLNLFLSMMAGLQGAILLISAKRSDQIAAQLALHDYEADQRSEKMLEDITVGFADMQKQHATMAGQLARIHQNIIPDLPETASTQ